MKLTKIKLHYPQGEFFSCGPQPTLFLGGVGSGKTWIGILKMLYLLDEYPGSRGVIIRQRFSALKKTTVATLRKLLLREYIARRNDNEGFIQLTNGSELLLMHLDKPDSIDNLKSLELNFAFVDQLEDLSSDAWDTLLERLGRWSGALKKGGYPDDWRFVTEEGERVPPPYAFASAYSPGYDHWITKRWWENGDDRERYRKEGYVVYIGSTRNNPNLTKQYVDGRLAMGKEYIERFVDATSWGANEGLIFEVTPDSIVEPTPDLINRIYSRMCLHRVLDPGDFTTTACGWYATDNDQNVFFYREYGEDNLLVSAHRRNIYELSRLDSSNNIPPVYSSNYADPVISKKSRGRTATQGPQWSVRDEWSDRKVQDPETAVYWREADNNESMTISRVREYLRHDPAHRNPITGQMGAPRLYFVKKTYEYPHGCREIITDIRSARRVEVGQNADGTKQFGDKRDDKVRDHYLDLVRYAIGMRPKLAAGPGIAPAEPGTIRINEYWAMAEKIEQQAELDRMLNFKGHNRYGYH